MRVNFYVIKRGGQYYAYNESRPLWKDSVNLAKKFSKLASARLSLNKTKIDNAYIAVIYGDVTEEILYDSCV